MRACRYAAAVLGIILACVFATTETINAAAGIRLPAGFRYWMAIAIILIVTIGLDLVLMERQQRILDRLDEDEAARRSEARAETDYQNIQRRLRPKGTVTDLYPEE